MFIIGDLTETQIYYHSPREYLWIGRKPYLYANGNYLTLKGRLTYKINHHVEKYYLDWYVKGEEGVTVFECDEQGHNTYPSTDELRRMATVASHEDCPVEFFRFYAGSTYGDKGVQYVKEQMHLFETQGCSAM